MAENLFDVFCEVWIEHRGLAGFFFVRFGQSYALSEMLRRTGSAA